MKLMKMNYILSRELNKKMAEKELTEKEAIRALDKEMYAIDKAIYDKYPLKHGGRDGGPTQELRELNIENGRRYGKIKEMYMGHETLPESEVMKIVRGEF